MTKHAKTFLVAVSAAAALVLGLAGPASAHVTVTSSSTTGGSYAVLTFTVPVESPTAHAVGLTVELPTATPFTSVLSAPVPGWSAELTSSPLAEPLKDDDGNAITAAVTEVTWTADSGGLAPGQFGQFSLSVGPLPTGGTLYLPAVQRYSDGTQVNWVQQAQGSAEPEHPAPSVAITAVTPAAATSGGSGDGWGVGLGVSAIVLALAAGAVGGAALSRARRPAVRRPVEGGADLTRTPS